MQVREKLGGLIRRITQFASQFYTPRELRALLLFLLTGVAVLLFRFGKQIYGTAFPSAVSTEELAQKHQQDSLFFALSAAANARDSLFFSLPEDSLLPSSQRHPQHHSKEEGLLPHSISLNKGSKEELTRLPGVGPTTAERILEYRSERGKFRSLEELKNIHGFGDARFDRMKQYLRLD